jgi:hypothetical protein
VLIELRLRFCASLNEPLKKQIVGKVEDLIECNLLKAKRDLTQIYSDFVLRSDLREIFVRLRKAKASLQGRTSSKCRSVCHILASKKTDLLQSGLPAVWNGEVFWAYIGR